MARYPFVITDVFTDRPFAGNQLAVVLDADGITGAQMQRVAAEFGFSETSFVQGRPEAPAVRIFTPAAELPFAGHPTIGTALVLAWRGIVPAGAAAVTLHEGAGPVRVGLDWADGRAVRAELTAPAAVARGAAADPAAVAAALGLEPADLVTGQGLPLEAACGIPFLMVELAAEGALGRARLVGGSGADLSPRAASGLYLFVRSPEGAVRARMFAPEQGIAEDPATGSAAAALAGLLGGMAGTGDGWRAWSILQGVEMGRPSRIEARARVEAGHVAEVRVAGTAVQVAEGVIDIPPG